MMSVLCVGCGGGLHFSSASDLVKNKKRTNKHDETRCVLPLFPFFELPDATCLIWTNVI